ncbi:hypothetical protein [Rahnella sp. PCH160]|uniref:hypothetical protein n=1 Tax=Rahnella sp. PCH160 TaxID=3447928 RepID=UPI0039FC108A
MKYLSTSIWIYKPAVFLTAVICLGLGFFHVNGPLVYMVCVGLIFPVGMSVHLHRLKDQALIYMPEKKSDWMIYVHGIPVRDSHSSLSNPFFMNKELLKTFYTRMFVVKIIIQGFALFLTISQSWPYFMQFSSADIAIQAVLFIALFIQVLRFVRTSRNLFMVFSEKWVLSERENSESGFVTAFFKHTKRKQTTLISGLDSLLAL